jgi:nucleoside-diphosphate-sugar epimerase
VGGVGYFHKHNYEVLSHNENINISVFNSAIKLFKNKILEKIVVISSSAIFDSCINFPSSEKEIDGIKIPPTLYGLQRLATEYFAKSAFQQYGLPYQIIRPSNCTGIGELEGHIIPDLINKLLQESGPLHILGDGDQLRDYVHGKDLARGIRLVMESDYLNDSFNISTIKPISVLELAKLIWDNLRKDLFEYVSMPSLKEDVPIRSLDTKKMEKLFNFKGEISLEDTIKETINYIKPRNIKSNL